MLYAQPDSFSAPANLSQPNVGVSVFDFPAYVKVCIILLSVFIPSI